MNDLISRQAAIDALCKAGCGSGHCGVSCDDVKAIEQLPSAQPGQQWIPIKMRPMDSEEREYWECQCGYELKEEDAVMFDCQMPDDGQEILISFQKWINMDRCEIDGGFYGLEGNGDWEGVIAWMPLPEPYIEAKEGEEA